MKNAKTRRFVPGIPRRDRGGAHPLFLGPDGTSRGFGPRVRNDPRIGPAGAVAASSDGPPGRPRPKVVIVEPMDPGPRALLARRLDVIYRPGLGTGPNLPLHRLVRAIAPDVLVVRNRTYVGPALLDAAGPGLRLVGRLGAGLDNIDRDTLSDRGIRLIASPATGAVAVAELVFAYLLHVSRHLTTVDASVRAGGWDRDQLAGRELAGRRLGLVGLGEVGLRVAVRARAFDMRVAAYDPGLPRHSYGFDGLGVRRAEDLRALLGPADFVSLHVPLTPATHHLIAAETLSRMRRGSHLVNTSRGEVVDERALADALARGQIGGCLLDVREHEPPDRPDPLSDFPQVLMTPHIGGIAQESRIRTGREVAQGILAALARPE